MTLSICEYPTLDSRDGKSMSIVTAMREPKYHSLLFTWKEATQDITPPVLHASNFQLHNSRVVNRLYDATSRHTQRADKQPWQNTTGRPSGSNLRPGRVWRSIGRVLEG